MNDGRSLRSSQGFSLVELLVVISVIAVIASLAIPNLATISQNAHFAKNERNAQTIASLAAAVRAGGATNQWTTIDDVVDDLENAITLTNGGVPATFRISPLTPEERDALTNYLVVNLSDGQVAYRGPTP
jgi:prepilin-type N-terminal cleavage/methylation domain-containing protein